MKHRNDGARADRRVKSKRFPATIFVITFIIMALLTTVQNRILSGFLDYAAVPPIYFAVMAAHWIIVSAAFTVLTRWQIVKAYDRPMKRLAKATRDVAGGDFSVYVRPAHTAERADYLDIMIEDFNKMVAELGSIETLKTEFFSNVSHEIKTPLAVIQNHAELLQSNGITDEQRKEYADAIIRSVKKLSGLIANILKLNRLEQQKIKSASNRYDLCAQLSECALQFESVWERKGINFEFEAEDKAAIEADESLLELVWSNLISNALKFTGSGGTVRFSQTSERDAVAVVVSDTGCGMSEETLKHVFDKFYQGDDSRASEGNGLGLALSLRIIQLSDGEITAKSKPGEGSEFTVRLPVGRGENERGGGS